MSNLTFENVVQFLWREAEILDTQSYDEWLELWDKEGLYIIPIDQTAEDYADTLNYAYDDDKMRRKRVVRLQSSFSQSALTAARTVRTTSRFVVVDHSENEMTLRAAQHLVEYRRDIIRILAADVDIVVINTNDGLKLKKKIVKLINGEEAVSAMGFLL
ncbi:aromatic-ring-hydroxylating dioxygenase subunit beta [Hirschia litorea]|uniref:Aromatic-ring-hydroxylating dioxygenase subunit beta n=1 Tax=Hirschia litorea TaxID=1199156 RepID=A0ABW2IKA9_9PROT